MKKIEEEKIRPETVFNKFLELSEQDAKKFFNKEKFHHINCPACGHDQIETKFTKHSFQYVECSECHSLYNSPRPSLDETFRYYSDSESASFWAKEVLRKTKEQRKNAIVTPNVKRIGDLLKDRTSGRHRIIDVGAATGVFLQEWKKVFEQAELIAIEPGPEGAQACREIGAQVAEGLIENVAGDLEGEGDIVTCFEVIEHVHDPVEFAKAIHKIVAPQGCAVVTGLGVEGFDIQLLWDKSRSIMPPYHLNFMSVKGIEKIFKNAGFDEVEVITPGRLDVEIVERAVERGEYELSNRFERLLMSKSEETKVAFQKFLAEHQMSSHVWAICKRNV
ncbi:class I SAM-dependent methyltransferase [Terasakiella sp.]|uniref:class I SAM-dependent methyltransferase n=1 Tax=Terasakiella sp. TaxID=2034861 RepID=UPI003AA9BD33